MNGRLALAMVLAVAPAIVSTSAFAQTTCSIWRAECRGTACDDSFNKCMKTGRWIGPNSGRDYGAAAKQ